MPPTDTIIRDEPSTEIATYNGGTGSALTSSDQHGEIVQQPYTQEITQFQPRTFGELVIFSENIARTPFVPKEFMNKPADIVAAVMYGAELGIKPMQALQSICVINGKPSVYGDTMLALVRNATYKSGQPIMIDFAEGYTHDEKGNVIGAWCESLRYGAQRPKRTEFTVEQAKKASLWGKAGPWMQYPERMLMFRSRSWNLRDNFGDVLKGMQCVEEMVDVQPIRTVQTLQAGQPIGVTDKGAQVRSRMQIPSPAAPSPAPKSDERKEAEVRFRSAAESLGVDVSTVAAVTQLRKSLGSFVTEEQRAAPWRELTARDLDTITAAMCEVHRPSSATDSGETSDLALTLSSGVTDPVDEEDPYAA